MNRPFLAEDTDPLYTYPLQGHEAAVHELPAPVKWPFKIPNGSGGFTQDYQLVRNVCIIFGFWTSMDDATVIPFSDQSAKLNIDSAIVFPGVVTIDELFRQMGFTLVNLTTFVTKDHPTA